MTIKGTTRIQKYGFLASQLYSKELKNLDFYDDWTAYSYGPHSVQLMMDLREGVDKNLVDEQIVKTSTGRELHVYSLNMRGRKRLQELLGEYGNIIKELYDKFTKMNKRLLTSILKDIYESYPKFAANSKIKEEVLGSIDESKTDESREQINSEIEEKIELAESGKARGKKYTPSEYLRHIDQILED